MRHYFDTILPIDNIVYVLKALLSRLIGIGEIKGTQLDEIKKTLEIHTSILHDAGHSMEYKGLRRSFSDSVLCNRSSYVIYKMSKEISKLNSKVVILRDDMKYINYEIKKLREYVKFMYYQF